MTCVFVTGTGTEVGKTLVTRTLIGQLRQAGRTVHALKPLVTGYAPGGVAAPENAGSDPHLILEALGVAPTDAAVAAIAPWRFAAPLAPDAAATLEGRHIDYEELRAFCRAEMAAGAEDADVLIEGIGGAFVPLAERRTVADWIADLAVPAVVVAGSYLGTLSHTIATLEALRDRGIDIALVVVSASDDAPDAPQQAARALAPFLNDAPLCVIPRMDRTEWTPGPPDDIPDLLGALG